MAFGVKRHELIAWKKEVDNGNIAFLTHYWLHPRFPDVRTVTKVGCNDMNRLTEWLLGHGLEPRYIHSREPFPHFDLIGPKQREILEKENQWEQIKRFNL